MMNQPVFLLREKDTKTYIVLLEECKWSEIASHLMQSGETKLETDTSRSLYWLAIQTLQKTKVQSLKWNEGCSDS